MIRVCNYLIAQREMHESGFSLILLDIRFYAEYISFIRIRRIEYLYVNKI